MTWTKLGLLYLHYGDLELANQTFNRVQTLDAEYTLAWLGQALVAIAHGYDADATILLEHAVTLTMSVVSSSDFHGLRFTLVSFYGRISRLQI